MGEIRPHNKIDLEALNDVLTKKRKKHCYFLVESKGSVTEKHFILSAFLSNHLYTISAYSSPDFHVKELGDSQEQFYPIFTFLSLY